MKKLDISRRDFLKSSGAGAVGIAAMSLLGSAAAAEAEGATPETATAAADPLTTPIYCVDRFETRPGEGPEFLAYFLETYGPVAESAGAVLESTLISPPLWLDNVPNVVEVRWLISGFYGWAGLLGAVRNDPAQIEYWKDIRYRVVSHERNFFAKESDLEVINNV